MALKWEKLILKKTSLIGGAPWQFTLLSKRISETHLWMPKLSPERIRTSKILRTHKDKAVEVLGVGYEVTLQERFDKTLIRLEIKLTPPPQKKKKLLRDQACSTYDCVVRS